MKISVIIPTYKPKDYLWECLHSLVNQTFPKDSFEVIIILNGCTDPWKQQIEYYINERMSHMNVKFFHTEQGGVSNARNIGLDIACGEYIAFIDDDDYVSPSYLEGLYSVASKETVSLSNAYAFIDGSLEQSVEYALTHVYDNYSSCEDKRKISLKSKVRKFFSGPCMKLIPRSLIQDSRFDINFSNGEDSLFMFLISNRIKDISFATRNVVYYRRFRANSAVTKRRSRASIILNCLKLMRCYTKIYLSSISTYSFSFYFTRILASVKSMI